MVMISSSKRRYAHHVHSIHNIPGIRFLLQKRLDRLELVIGTSLEAARIVDDEVWSALERNLLSNIVDTSRSVIALCLLKAVSLESPLNRTTAFKPGCTYHINSKSLVNKCRFPNPSIPAD